MTHEELIARQALRIATLEDALKDREDRLRSIKQRLVCVGGPLNDNRLQYSPEQLGPLHLIADDATL